MSMSQLEIEDTRTELTVLEEIVLSSFGGYPELYIRDLNFGNIPKHEILGAIARLKDRGLVSTRIGPKFELVDLRQ